MGNKAIIFQVTRTYMRKNRKRTLVTFLGILVMVMLMTAVFVGKDTLLRYVQNAAAADKGSWHYQVYDINREQADQIRSLGFVEKFAVSRPLGYTEFAASGNPAGTPYLEIKAYSEELFAWLNIRVLEGRYPENADEVIISERARKEGAAISLGDTIEADCFERYIHALSEAEQKAVRAEGAEPSKVFFPAGFHITPGETRKVGEHFPYYENNDLIEMIHKPTGVSKRLTVVGIMEEPYYGSPQQGGYIALTGTDDTVNGNETVNAVLKIDRKTREDCMGELAKILDSSDTPEEKEAAIRQGTSYTTKTGERIPLEQDRIISNDMLLMFEAKGQDKSMNSLLIICQAFFVVLITAASLVLICNVFSMSYQERCKYLGMLSSVGATRRQKRWSVYYEVFSLLSLALPLGICIGVLTVKGGMALLYPHFSKIIGSIAENVISGRSCEITYKIIINPVNIVFVVLFSAAAVWVSAWIPARKISKIGPVESIRGNEISGKRKKKGYRTYRSLMLKGEAEKLIGTASVGRNRTSTRGIIRSITAFTALTLITAFAARSITDILDSTTNREELLPGAVYTGYSYMFQNAGFLDAEWYQAVRDEILNSDEVSACQEMDVMYFVDGIPLRYYKQEYVDAVTQILEKWFPYGTPEQIQQYLVGDAAHGKNPYSNPQVDIITMNEKDFHRVAERAGISLAKYEDAESAPVLVYDSLRLTTQDYTFFDEGAEKPDYTEYNLTKPLNVKEGDEIRLEILEFNEQNEQYKVSVPVTFAGYFGEKDIQDYYTLNGSRVFFIIPEQTQDSIRSVDPVFGKYYTCEKCVFFNLKTEDSGLLKRLAPIRDEYGRNALARPGIFSEYTDFKGAVTKIANIVAVCFTLMIALICLLNLYNSVMGRCLARHRELAVLHAIGMTQQQKHKMLMIENLQLLARAFFHSALITLTVVLCFHKLLNLMLGRMQFTVPVWVILLTVLVSIVGLTVSTVICYGHDSKSQIIEEIRMDSL